MYEMAYNKGKNILTMLEPDGITSRFVFTHPLNTIPYNALTLNDPDLFHISLDTISSLQFIATREKSWILQHANQLSNNPAAVSNDCINNDIVEIDVIQKQGKEPNFNPLLYDYGMNVVSPTKPPLLCIIQTHCVSK